VRAPFWRRRLLPLVLALLGLNLVVLVGWTAPRAWRQRNAAARADAARATVERLRATTAALRLRAETIRANASDRERFYRALVGTEKADLLPTLEAIEDLARSPGLKPGARTVRREEVKDAPIDRVVVTLPLEGSYAQLVRFLGEVERAPRFLTVDRVAMRAHERGGTALQVEVSAYLRRSGEAGKEKLRGRT
jgi:Tfp pilus assembly protein PilO